MNYKDLANLIFPEAKEISYYEEKYPRRELEERSNSYKICTKSNRICTYRRIISRIDSKKISKSN